MANVNQGNTWMHTVELTDPALASDLYMPFLRNGGLFVETSQRFELGDPLFVLLSIGPDGVKCPISGKVAWINYDSARSSRPVGVGISFSADASGEKAREEIERFIGPDQNQPRRTATL